jgi:hypothetical protein
MIVLVLAVITYFRAFFVGRHRLGLEIAALRQQLVVFKRKRPRPHLCDLDRAFWVALRRWWPGWANALIIVKPDTVARFARLPEDEGTEFAELVRRWAVSTAISVARPDFRKRSV